MDDSSLKRQHMRCLTPFLVLLVSSLGLAAEEAPRWVLPPSTGELLIESFRRTTDDVRLAGGNVVGDSIELSVCSDRAEAACGTVWLSRASAGCAGIVASTWCIEAASHAPPALVAAVQRTIERMPDPWIRAERESDPAAESQSRPVTTFTIAALLILVPAALGIAAGFALRRALRGNARRWSAAAVAIPVGVAFLTPVAATWSAWDLIMIGVLAALGMFFGMRLPSSRALMAWAVVAGVTVLGVELGARVLLPPASDPAPGRSPRLRLTSDQRDPVCRWMYPDENTPYADRGLRRGGVVRELHLGDSMVYGEGVAPDRAVPGLLQARHAGMQHLNAGMPNSGIDAQWVALPSWLERYEPSSVVLYPFSGNDLLDIDRPYPCCGALSAVTYANGEPRPRCATPRWSLTPSFFLSTSPPPFPLRAATAFSAAARHGVAAFNRLASDVFGPPRQPPEQAWLHQELVLRALHRDLQARGISLTIVVLPDRAALESPESARHPSSATQARLVAMGHELGIRTLDAAPVLLEAVRERGGEALFIDSIHLSPAGHELLATWLDPQLREGGEGAGPGR